MKKSLIVIVYLLATGLGICGQLMQPHASSSTAAPPLKIEYEQLVKHHTSDSNPNATYNSPALAMTVTNVSQKCVRGYVIKTKFMDSEGNVMLVHYRRVLVDKARACQEPGFIWPPGNTYNFPLDANGNPAATYTGTIDLVIFDDGSEWGPGTTVQSQILRGMSQALFDSPPARK